jgi:son of sevenless
VEKHGLLIDDPALVPRLCDFLSLIKPPHANALTAKQLRETIDKTQQRLSAATTRSSTPSPTSATVSLSSSFPKRRQTKKHKNEFLKCDPGELANQLTLLESKAYMRIRPGELLIFPQSPKGDGVRNLISFCAMNDRLAAWVKLSILSNDGLGKRADTIDHWIKVAEVRRRLDRQVSADQGPVSAVPSDQQHIFYERDRSRTIRRGCEQAATYLAARWPGLSFGATLQINGAHQQL